MTALKSIPSVSVSVSVSHARNGGSTGANGPGMRPMRVHIGRRFRNDTERLEKLFEMYTEMTTETVAR